MVADLDPHSWTAMPWPGPINTAGDARYISREIDKKANFQKHLQVPQVQPIPRPLLPVVQLPGFSFAC